MHSLPTEIIQCIWPLLNLMHTICFSILESRHIKIFKSSLRVCINNIHKQYHKQFYDKKEIPIQCWNH